MGGFRFYALEVEGLACILRRNIYSSPLPGPVRKIF